MARPGPRPKPTALKILEGNPGKRALPVNEVHPLVMMPECPEWLAPQAQREWQKIAPQLLSLGLLTELDQMSLAAYCAALAQWRAAQMVVDEEGLTLVTTSGYLQQRPEVGIAARSMAMVRAFSGEFGATPSARSRLNPPAPDSGPPSVAELIDT